MERARVGPSRSPLYRVYRGIRWLTCAIPPVAVIILEETPGLSGLDGINAAGLVVLSPFVVILGFGLTAAVVALARWTYSKTQMRSRVGFALLMLLLVGALSPIAYLDRDWMLLAVIEAASLPAALILGPAKLDREAPHLS